MKTERRKEVYYGTKNKKKVYYVAMEQKQGKRCTICGRSVLWKRPVLSSSSLCVCSGGGRSGLL